MLTTIGLRQSDQEVVICLGGAGPELDRVNTGSHAPVQAIDFLHFRRCQTGFFSICQEKYDIRSHPQASGLGLNRMLEVEHALEDCVIVGSVTTVLE